MPSEAPYRLSITEYQDAPTAVAEAASALGVGRAEILEFVEAANQRLARHMRVPKGPLQVLGDGLRVEDLAGLVRLSPRLELEVAPKFLGDAWTGWREDFFLIATLSRYGTLLARDRLSAGFGDRGDLATLVGRAVVDEYWRHHRRPLRTYHRQVWRDFSMDGDVAPEEFVAVDPDGYEQEVVRFSRMNEFNSVMHSAAAELLSEVRDSETRQQLRRVRDALAPQATTHRRSSRSVPTRHRRWQTLYDLSSQVLGGFGVNLATAQHLLAPGYVLRTPKAWEDVLVAALRSGVPGATVRAQHGFVLGQRDGKDFKTTPDVTVELGAKRVLVDAKYKTRVGQELGRVVPEDVYEGLAFMRAGPCSKLALVYPAPPDDLVPASVGTAQLFEKITIEDMAIYALHVECRGLAATNGFRTFGERLGPVIAGLLVS